MVHQRRNGFASCRCTAELLQRVSAKVSMRYFFGHRVQPRVDDLGLGNTKCSRLFEKVFQLSEMQQGPDSVVSLRVRFGILAGGKLLGASIINLLPVAVRRRYTATQHFAASNVSK